MINSSIWTLKAPTTTKRGCHWQPFPVHEAAWNAAEGRSIARLAPMAKLFACNTYQQSTRMCAQVWGGVAFTIEYDVQMFFRRAKEMQLSWWDTPYLEELVAADVLDD